MALKQIVHFNIPEYFAAASMSNWCSIVAWLLFWHMVCDAYLNPSSGCLKPSEWQQCVYFPEEWFSFCFGIFLNCLMRWWSWRSCLLVLAKPGDHFSTLDWPKINSFFSAVLNCWQLRNGAGYVSWILQWN
jgi:hypothetical protein